MLARQAGSDGEKGNSLVISVIGRPGLWIDHATQERGDALDLVKGVLNFCTREAIEWSNRWLARHGDQLRAPAPKAGDGL